MGHTISRHARPARRYEANAAGQVPFSPLWQPQRLLLRVRRHGVVTLEQPALSSVSSIRLRSAKRIFRATSFTQL